MLASKLCVTGPVVRLESDRIVVRVGGVTDIYSRDYYRIIPEVEQQHGPVQRTANLERKAANR